MPPIALMKNSAKKNCFWPKNAILALLDQFFKENFRRLSFKGAGGSDPLSAKGFP